MLNLGWVYETSDKQRLPPQLLLRLLWPAHSFRFLLLRLRPQDFTSWWTKQRSRLRFSATYWITTLPRDGGGCSSFSLTFTFHAGQRFLESNCCIQNPQPEFQEAGHKSSTNKSDFHFSPGLACGILHQGQVVVLKIHKIQFENVSAH